MMCTRLLRPTRASKKLNDVAAANTARQPVGYSGRIAQPGENAFAWMSESYRRSLQIVLRHPAITLAVLIVTIAATGYLFVTVPKGFFPLQDNGTVFGGMQGSQNTSFQPMQHPASRVNSPTQI